MAFSCAFSSGFSNGFAICDDEPAPEVEAPTLRGVPALKPRKRAQSFDVAGSGTVSIIGTAHPTAELCLRADARQEVAGGAILRGEAHRLLVGAIQSGAEALLAVERAAMVWVPFAVVSHALAAVETVLTASLGQPFTMRGVLSRDRRIGGGFPIRTGAEALAVMIDNDEQVALALLGLPSEMGLTG